MDRIAATLSRRIAAASQARQNAFRENHLSLEKFQAWLDLSRRAENLRAVMRARMGMETTTRNELPILLGMP